MWHASASAMTTPTAWAMAERALVGVGDAALGEWREAGASGIVHIRRRLSAEERATAGGLAVTDVRGTPEERARIDAVLREVPQLRGLL